MIYLDYSANTPCDERVLDTYLHTEKSYIGNPNSNHSAGREEKTALSQITDSISARLGVQPAEFIYTSGASEANNLSIKGIAHTSRHYGKHIISTPLEHASVSGPMTYLQEQGYEIDLVNIGRDGKVDLISRAGICIQRHSGMVGTF